MQNGGRGGRDCGPGKGRVDKRREQSKKAVAANRETVKDGDRRKQGCDGLSLCTSCKAFFWWMGQGATKLARSVGWGGEGLVWRKAGSKEDKII